MLQINELKEGMIVHLPYDDTEYDHVFIVEGTLKKENDGSFILFNQNGQRVTKIQKDSKKTWLFKTHQEACSAVKRGIVMNTKR
jgi:hypothetical protein